MKKFSFIFLFLVTSTSVFAACGLKGIQVAEGRVEQLPDSSNNNLRISMEAPDFWNTGIISQTIANLDWRLNGLDAINDDMSAFFIVVNTPSVVNIALPLGQKTGILSLLLSQYVTINAESDLTLSDGSAAHRYSISITPAQLHRLKAPIDKGFDGIIITTKQQSTTYFIIYASELGKMSQFESVFQNILNSVKFGSVSLSGATNTSPSPTKQNQLNVPQLDGTNSVQNSPPASPSGPVFFIHPSCGRANPGFNVVIDANGFKSDSTVHWNLVTSQSQIPLYGYFQSNSTGGFSDVIFMDDLNPGNYKIYLFTDANNDNKIDAGAPLSSVGITIPCH